MTSLTQPLVPSPREQMGRTLTDLLGTRTDLALAYAEVSGVLFAEAARAHPERVVNVGIREQLLVSVGAGLALAGLRPVVHTFASFLVERAFEQIKLDFAHQGVGGVLVSAGASYDVSAGGRTHQAPGDVALLDTVPGMRIHAPADSAGTDATLRAAAAGTGLDYVRLSEHTSRAARYRADGRLDVHRRGRRGVVVVLGPLLDETLEATAGLDVTVAHTGTVRPFDTAGLRALTDASAAAEVVVVEPWLAGTSAWVVADALRDRPHRLLGLGTRREPELRRYGTPAEHATAHGLDAGGLRHDIVAFLDGSSG